MADDESIQSVFERFSEARAHVRNAVFESKRGNFSPLNNNSGEMSGESSRKSGVSKNRSSKFIDQQYKPAMRREMSDQKRIADELAPLLAGEAHIFTVKNEADVFAVGYLFKQGSWTANKLKIDPELDQHKAAKIKNMIGEIKAVSGANANKGIEVLPPPPANQDQIPV